ncbi:MAG: hypothetical protein KF805_09925 [Phycisphaeraceae bacterium]|nr:hypothetical protein [Phycisphaeraceae bacterium]
MINRALLAVGVACVLQPPARSQSTSGAVGQPVPQATAPADVALPGSVASELIAHVRSIAQDQRGNMWFATDGQGLCRWDGKSFTFFTEKEGLPNDYVRTVQIDSAGNLWITTRDGLCRFDGNIFTRVPVPPAADPPLLTPDLLWFESEGGAMHFDGDRVGFLRLPVEEADKNWRSEVPGLNPYRLYSVHKARDGTVWFGTETRGVCRWDGKSFTWLREVDLDKSVVRSIFQDARGHTWMGNSGVGLFRYDGKELRNFGDDNNIGNRTWLQGSLIRIPGTIGDPHAIMQDKDENVWIGAFDSGVWRYDGATMTNFTTKDGLPVDAVSAIYEDRAGKLWFGTRRGVCTFDGKVFAPVRGAADSKFR